MRFLRKLLIKLRARVTQAAQAALQKKGYVTAVDVLTGMGWLDEATHSRWRKRQLPFLERGIKANLPRISEAMRLFRAWALSRGLYASETAYVAKRPPRVPLQFSKSGEPAIEAMYRTHWVSRSLSEKKQAKRALQPTGSSTVPSMSVSPIV